jgi:large subunit ribosomal protein L9
LPDPIRTVGSHEVELKLHREVSAKIKVEVAAEG